MNDILIIGDTMKQKKVIIIVIMLMAVGFAAVATNLFVNGSSKINPNKDDFYVYYSDAYVNDEQDDSVITSDTTIEFNTTFESLGQKYILEYEVTNGSKNYDAELEMVCTGGNEYLSLINDFDDNAILEATTKRFGMLTLEQVKSYSGDDLNVSIECTINANAVERSSLGTNDLSVINGYILEGNYVDEEENAIQNANLVVFSDTPHYVTTDENGYFICSGLERGSHEIYYVEDTLDNIKTMTKSEIVDLAMLSSKFKTSMMNDIVFENNTRVQNVVLRSQRKYCEETINSEYTFDYTKKQEEFLAICPGTYKLETWGAQGGDGYYSSIRATGGYGSYSVGEIILEANSLLYINVGGEGVDGSMPAQGTSVQAAGGYNGGGNGYSYYPSSKADFGNGGGGGATHIGLKSGLLSSYEKDSEQLLIVSAGGGGASTSWYTEGYYKYSGGHAGGYVGNNGAAWSGYKYGTGGTQEAGGTGHSNGSIGLGGNGCSGGSGGGAGYYGGGGSGQWASGGGGSSYIGNQNLTNKGMYCYSCSPSADVETYTESIGCASQTPTEKCAKLSNGYAKITYMG